MEGQQLKRLAIIAGLVKREPGVGRTVLMKWLFLLKALKHVQLHYNFRLYTYGPFDGSVLEDLEYAEAIGVVEGKATRYPGGYYGYSYREGAKAGWVANKESAFLAAQRDNIDWVVDGFRARTAVELELASTLVYVDGRLGSDCTMSDLVDKVHNVKRHRSRESIARTVDWVGKYLTARV